jgi:hypothetical protein
MSSWLDRTQQHRLRVPVAPHSVVVGSPAAFQAVMPPITFITAS